MKQNGQVTLEIVITVFIAIIVLTILMQPFTILADVAQERIEIAAATPMKGTNSDGEVITVGGASALPNITLMLMFAVGLAIVIGLIIWIINRPSDPSPGFSGDFGAGFEDDF